MKNRYRLSSSAPHTKKVIIFYHYFWLYTKVIIKQILFLDQNVCIWVSCLILSAMMYTSVEMLSSVVLSPVA